MTNLPPLNALRAFDEAGRCLTFRGAADQLVVTQGAVAQHIRGLEAHLGVTLFERHAKGLHFTPAGRSYHAQVQAAFAILRDATETLQPQADKVLISVTPTFASKWLIPNLPAFTEQHPEIDLRIIATEQVSRFHSDGIDLAVRHGNPPFGASLDAHLLFQQDIIAVAAPHIVDTVPVTHETLQTLPKIHDSHALWPRFLADLGLSDQSGRGLQLSQTALAIDAANAGQGVTLASRFLVERDIAAGHLIQITSHVMQAAGDFYLLARRASSPRAALIAVTHWILQHAGAD
ncbi:MAG: LysR substrate-binding domain-containing protein [Paracoccaceae bacterium]